MSQEQGYVVSALKYRPAEWDEVVGQSAITSTLKNAIGREEIAKAYLFCGPRGVGKTTSARIFAKAINANYVQEGEEMGFNIFELDAASNNSVDDIRQLIDQVRIQPQLGKYKVYIIDEVHMLSTQAFNAFLKTLEEPPPHAIFILATTEKHKVLPTILSRCQIYDFQRIQVRDMVDHLARIAKDQEVTFEEEALHLIATKADGALRDALSLFDQMVSFTGKNLEYAAVAANLNVLDHEFFGRVVKAMATGDVPQAMLTYDEILKKGFDSLLFMVGLAEHLRNLMVAKDQATVSLIDAPDSVKRGYLEQSAMLSIGQIVSHLNTLHQTEVNYRQAKNKRLLTEITLMKLCAVHGLPEDGAVEKKKSSVVLKAPEPIAAEPAPAKPTPAPSPSPAPVAAKERPVAPATPEMAAPLPQAPPPIEEPQAMSSQPVAPSPTSPSAPAPVKEAIAPSPEPAIASPSAAVKAASTIAKSSGARRRRGISLSELDDVEETDISTKEEDTGGQVEGKTVEKDNLMRVWKAYAQILYDDKKYSFHSSLNNREPEIINDFTIKLVLENAVQMELLNHEKAGLMAYLREHLDHPGLSLEAEVSEDDISEVSFRTSKDQLREMVKKNPVLQKMYEKFDLDII